MIREEDAAEKMCPFKAQNSDLTRRGTAALITCSGNRCMAWNKPAASGYTYLRDKDARTPWPVGMMQVDYEARDLNAVRERMVRIGADPAFGYCRLVQPDFPERS